MTSLGTRLVPVVLFTLLATPTLDAQDGAAASDPAAAALLTRVVDALGGADVYRKSLDAKLTAHSKVITSQADMRVEFDFVLYTRRDGARRLEKIVFGDRHVTGTDGTDYWWVRRDNSVADLGAREKARLLVDRAQLGILTEYEKLGFIAKLGKEVTEKERKLLHVRFRRPKGAGAKPAQDGKPKPGDRFDFYFDGETLLPAKVVFRVPDLFRKGSYELTVRMADYKTTGGWRHATRLIHERGGEPVEEITVQAVEVGMRHEDRLFKRPTRS